MNNGNRVFGNFIWRFAERCGAQAVQTIVSLVLARILTPEVFGTVALVTVFANVFQVFVDSGLGNALIQKKDADDLDFSSVFYFNIIWCIVLYIILYMLAPYLASFYDDPSLTSIIRVLCLTIIISGVKNVQQAYVSKTMQFKKFFYATLFGTIVSAFVGVWMAWTGAGIWALVAQKLTNLTIDTLVLWFVVKWHPKLMFSLTRLKGLLSYGWKLLVSSLLDTLYNNLRQLIIGKLYTDVDLAYYNQGKQIPDLLVNNVNLSIDSVLLPVMSEAQDERSRVKAMTRRSIKISTYIMAPIMIGLAVVAPALIELLLTSKWMNCVFYLRIFCVTTLFYPIHTANLNAIKAMGRSDLFLKLEVGKKVVGVLLLLLTMWKSVELMAYGLLVASLANQLINSGPNKKLLEYGYLEQLKDIIPNISLAIFMGVCVSTVGMLEMHIIIELTVQVLIGIIIYVFGSIITKNESFMYMQRMVWGYFKKNRS